MANASASMGVAARGCFVMSRLQLCTLLTANHHTMPAYTTPPVCPASTVLGGKTTVTWLNPLHMQCCFTAHHDVHELVIAQQGDHITACLPSLTLGRHRQQQRRQQQQ